MPGDTPCVITLCSNNYDIILVFRLLYCRAIFGCLGPRSAHLPSMSHDRGRGDYDRGRDDYDRGGPRSSSRGVPDAAPKIFVGNLHYDMTEEEFKAHFETCGKIVEVLVRAGAQQLLRGIACGWPCRLCHGCTLLASQLSDAAVVLYIVMVAADAT